MAELEPEAEAEPDMRTINPARGLNVNNMILHSYNKNTKFSIFQDLSGMLL